MDITQTVTSFWADRMEASERNTCYPRHPAGGDKSRTHHRMSGIDKPKTATIHLIQGSKNLTAASCVQSVCNTYTTPTFRQTEQESGQSSLQRPRYLFTRKDLRSPCFSGPITMQTVDTTKHRANQHVRPSSTTCFEIILTLYPTTRPQPFPSSIPTKNADR